MHVVQSKQANVPVPHSAECPTLSTNASLWLWINNSECWQSWVEPLLFIVGTGTGRWLLSILRTSRDRPPPKKQAVPSVSQPSILNHLHPLHSNSSFHMPLLSWSLSSPSVCITFPPSVSSVCPSLHHLHVSVLCCHCLLFALNS